MLHPINLLEFIFLVKSFFIAVCSIFLNFREHNFPPLFRRIACFGKFAYRGPLGKSAFLIIEVPKSWFRHFYLYASVLTLFTMDILIRVYFFDALPPKYIIYLIDFFLSPRSDSIVTPTSTLLSISLLTIQCLRRMYETYFVSVFSSTARINLSHYLIGYFHYTGCVLCILSSAPKFGQHAYRYPLIQLTDLSLTDVLATILFLWASYHQFKCSIILAKLRKNDKGEVVSQKHFLPSGDWFKYIAAPLMHAEILIYLAFTIILWENTTWKFIFTWVFVNQMQVALMNYWWYKENFPDFPKNRKALIPYVF